MNPLPRVQDRRLPCFDQEPNFKDKVEKQNSRVAMDDSDYLLYTSSWSATSFKLHKKMRPPDKHSFTHQILLFHFLISLVCEVFPASSAMLRGTDADHQALLAFKARITQDPHQLMTSWNDSTHFCHWRGVTCGHHNLRVTKLDLHSLHLAGSLPPQLGNLSFLQVLDLHQNNFRCEVPEEIGKLLRLERLVLDNNSFEGHVPGNISHCSRLIYLGLAGNKLTGPIPKELGSLQKLQVLEIHKNYLTGTIPHSLGNLSSLQHLSLALNYLHGTVPETIGQLKSLSFLALGVNSLSGTIPPSIYNLSSISVLSVPVNRIHGTLPPDLGFILPKLQILNIHTNRFTGQIPKSFTNASNLLAVLMGKNRFTGEVPSFASLHNLRDLYFTENNLGNGQDQDLNFLSSLVNCTDLRLVSAKDNNFGGVLPKSLSNLSTTLTTLELGSNWIHGTIPTGIGNLVNLMVLALEGNQLTGAIPCSIGNLHSLGILHLNGNKLSGTIPSSLGNLTNVMSFNLMINNLEGEIPLSLGNLKNLELLKLSENNFNGTIPKEVTSLSSLSKYLDLSQNQLSGPLPFDVGKLTMLGYLDVSGNNLSGEIPNSLGSCTSLISLNMNGNLFQGTIPQSLTSLRGIEKLDVSCNNLSGQIPNYLESFIFLRSLNLSYNDFEGEVPAKGVFSNATGLSVMGNKKICGGIPELELPICTVEKVHKKRLYTTVIIVIISIATLFIILALVATFYYLLLRRKKVLSETDFQDDFLMRLSYETLLKATNGFSSANLIGKGNFGSVYKGILEESKAVVAVKVLNLQYKGASKSFVAECRTLKYLRHRNLVKILTVCSGFDLHNNDFKALVYEYMPNGSLEEWLHPVPRANEQLERKRDLSLYKRLDIAIDVACAINYLHHGCHKPVVHCDLKPSNILIDCNMTACVADFGLARFLQEVSHVSSTNQSSTLRLKGSIGYVAPEYGMGSEVSNYGDVYSYGILLLEMFTWKKPTDSMFKDGLNLRKFAMTALHERVDDIVDPILFQGDEEEDTNKVVRNKKNRVRRDKSRECLISVLEIGLACSAESPRERMDIRDAEAMICKIRDNLL